MTEMMRVNGRIRDLESKVRIAGADDRMKLMRQLRKVRIERDLLMVRSAA